MYAIDIIIITLWYVACIKPTRSLFIIIDNPTRRQLIILSRN